MRGLDVVKLPWSVVGRDHRFAYVVVIAPEQPPGMPVPVVPLEPRSVLQMRQRLKEVERELEELDYRRIGLTKHSYALHEALDEADDRAARERAAQYALDKDQVFAVQGWAPSASVAALSQFATEHRLALTVASPGPNDTPPTKLDNPPVLRGGESLVEFYMTPGYGLWDPSKAVFFAFAAMRRVQDFDTFSFEAVVLYITRWDVIRHWQQLQYERGRPIFEKLVTEAMGEYAELYS